MNLLTMTGNKIRADQLTWLVFPQRNPILAKSILYLPEIVDIQQKIKDRQLLKLEEQVPEREVCGTIGILLLFLRQNSLTKILIRNTKEENRDKLVDLVVAVVSR